MLQRLFAIKQSQAKHVTVMKRTRRRVRFKMEQKELIDCPELKRRRMSFMFYKRLEKQTANIPAYGFEKKSATEVKAITERLAHQSTYNRRLSNEEATCVHNYSLNREHSAGKSRTPSACGHRSALSSAEKSSSRQSSATRRLNDREMQRLIRRLQKPTESYLTATTEEIHEKRNADLKQGRIIRSETADENASRSVRRFRRPTTASRAKNITECHLCHDHEHKKPTDPPDPFDFDYSVGRYVPKEELDYIVSRMRIPTCSSAHGTRTCAKTPVILDEVKVREALPLVSGLSRSKSYREVTNRLFPKPRYRMLPAATEVTVY